MAEDISEEVAKAREAVVELRQRVPRADEDMLDLIFRQARSHNGWLDTPVDDSVLRELYDLVKDGPTSGNCCPLRIVFVRKPEGKARLLPAVSDGNKPKVEQAPVTAIVAHDVRFFEKINILFPHRQERAQRFIDDPALAEITAFRNGSLQGAYFLLAARAVGLDTGPMSGFNNKMVDAIFFAGTSIRSNFICNLGYGDPEALFQKLPRLDFDTACTLA